MNHILTAREEIDAQIAGNAETLVEALRLPADYPARDEYIRVRMARIDVLVAERNRCFARSAAA